MLITLNDGRVFEIETADDIENHEILGERIASLEAENGLQLETTSALFEYLSFIAENDDNKAEAMLFWLSNVQPSDRTEDYIVDFSDNYKGSFDSEKDFAENLAKELYAEDLAVIPPDFLSAISWQAYWDQTLRHSYWYHGRHFFSN